MDFFKSVFQDDSDPPETESESEEHENPEQSDPNDGGWSFGGLMKTLATRSESVIETYRRDLEEFGTGLKKEIEVAQGSLGTMGHAIDELGNTVLKGIAQGKEAILAAGNESDSSDNSNRRDSFSSKPYSRFDAQVRVLQGDLNTYCEEPEDLNDYKNWESDSGFSLDEEEIEKLLEENGEMKGLYKKVVPNLIDHESFWFRYYYKVYKLKQTEDLRVNLVKRAISLDDEEELSWDIDDEEDEVAKEASRLKLEENEQVPIENPSKPEAVAESKEAIAESKEAITETKEAIRETKESVPSQESAKEAVAESKEAITETKEAITETKESVAESKESAKLENVVSSSTKQQSEEDLGWDEIEDMSSIDDKQTNRSSGGSPNVVVAELRKRLSVAEEDEDLSWDIEDDEEEESLSKA